VDWDHKGERRAPIVNVELTDNWDSPPWPLPWCSLRQHPSRRHACHCPRRRCRRSMWPRRHQTAAHAQCSEFFNQEDQHRNARRTFASPARLCFLRPWLLAEGFSSSLSQRSIGSVDTARSDRRHVDQPGHRLSYRTFDPLTLALWPLLQGICSGEDVVRGAAGPRSGVLLFLPFLTDKVGNEASPQPPKANLPLPTPESRSVHSRIEASIMSCYCAEHCWPASNKSFC
jgi:hypothetical protein